MRIFALLFAFVIGLAALTFAVSEASAKTITVKLTSQQVANVCGDRVETGGGHSGCSKPCGNGKHICEYDCNNKTKECGGQCLTCPQRKFPWGDNYSSHVVTKAVKAVP
jgi:hypothetical protein